MLSFIGMRFSSMAENNLSMLVGCYNTPGNPGLYLYSFNQDSATFSLEDSLNIDNPSYFAFNSAGDKLYCISENSLANSVASTIDLNKKNNSLQIINSVPLTGSPCYIEVNKNMALTANYGGGSIDVINIDEKGNLCRLTDTHYGACGGPDSTRQNLPHIHCVKFSPDGTYVFATDFSSDRLLRFDVNNSANSIIPTPSTIQLPDGTGCRHLIFSKDGRNVYLIGELSGNVAVFNIEDDEWEISQIIEADPVHERASADIILSPDERFLYVSNRRRNDRIAIFAVDPLSGKLTSIGYHKTGAHPRNIVITPNGRFMLVACRDSNSIEIYERNIETGQLTDEFKKLIINKPVCIKFI